MLCPICNVNFRLSLDQENLVSMVDVGKMKFAMLECGNCHQTFSYKFSSASVRVSLSYRCPVEGCIGYVANIVDVTDFGFGCGECGTVWSGKSDFYRSINDAVSSYPYRKKVYKFDGEEIEPVDPGMEPKDYEKKVLKEIK